MNKGVSAGAPKFQRDDSIYFQEHRPEVLKLNKLACRWHGPATITKVLRNNIHFIYNEKHHSRDVNDIKKAIPPTEADSIQSKLLQFGPSLRTKALVKFLLAHIPEPAESRLLLSKITTAQGKRWLTAMSKIVDKYQVALSTDSEKEVWYKHFSVEELTSYTETLPLKTRRLILSKLLSLRDFLFNLDDRNNQLAKFNH